jgi:hypothetical protein
MLCKCFTPCIYYNEAYSKLNKPSVKITCNIRDGKEIKDIPKDEIENCESFKTYNDIKWKKLTV